MKRAFTLIELLVVIAIIAILAAILFPVFAAAKESAKVSASVSNVKQLLTSVMIYATDADDFFVPASLRGTDPSINPTIWTEVLQPYVKNEQIFIAPDAPQSTYARNWLTRSNQTIGYSEATGINLQAPSAPNGATPGTEGFSAGANFSDAEETAKIGLFTTTPGAPAGKQRGYVFNPYNGATPSTGDPFADYRNGIPLAADVDLCSEASPILGDLTGRAPGLLKPVYARYRKTKRNAGVTPVGFADGHAKVYSAAAINRFGTIIWRFR